MMCPPHYSIIPAQAGIPGGTVQRPQLWAPAFAGARFRKGKL